MILFPFFFKLWYCGAASSVVLDTRMHIRESRVGNGKNHMSNHLMPTTSFTYYLFPLEKCSEAPANRSLNLNSHLSPAFEGSPCPCREQPGKLGLSICKGSWVMSPYVGGNFKSQAVLAMVRYLVNHLRKIISRNRSTFRLKWEINGDFKKSNIENVSVSQKFASFSKAISAWLIQGNTESLWQLKIISRLLHSTLEVLFFP